MTQFIVYKDYNTDLVSTAIISNKLWFLVVRAAEIVSGEFTYPCALDGLTYSYSDAFNCITAFSIDEYEEETIRIFGEFPTFIKYFIDEILTDAAAVADRERKANV